MRAETSAVLLFVEALPNYCREYLLQDLEPLVSSTRYYTAEDVANRYSVTGQTIRNWEKEKILVPDLRVGKGCVRYSAAVLAEFEKKHPGKKEIVAG